MQKIIAITTTVLLLICFSTLSAQADRKTMEGFILGTGVTILGTAIINGINKNSSPHYAQHYNRSNTYYQIEYRGYKNNYHRRYNHHRSRGYWKIERIWIDPIYEKNGIPVIITEKKTGCVADIKNL